MKICTGDGCNIKDKCMRNIPAKVGDPVFDEPPWYWAGADAQTCAWFAPWGRTFPVGWIHMDLLTAVRRGTARTQVQGGDHWWIRAANLRRFILEHPQQVDLRKVDRFWFIDLLGRRAA